MRRFSLAWVALFFEYQHHPPPLTLLVSAFFFPLCIRGGLPGPNFIFWIARLTDDPLKWACYSMEKYCPEDSKKYNTISVGGLRTEQFTVKIDNFYREKHKIFEGGKIVT